MTATRAITVLRADGREHDDVLAVEEPLEIRLGFVARGMRVKKAIAITMRTPGHDEELAVGFLHGESIIRTASDILDVRHCGDLDAPNSNVMRVDLAESVQPDLGRLQRNFYTTSSCGVCGKSSLEALDLTGATPVDSSVQIDAAFVRRLADRLRESQLVFDATGGLHAAALFRSDGELIALREDVGRHNALDKLVGWSLRSGLLPLSEQILLLSGRASFELLQKALAAGIGVVCAIGAPSSLAVDLADRFGITLLGFVSADRFNVYTHPQRLTLE